MKVNCPNCRATISAEDISLPTGWAKCRRCDDVFKLADVCPDFALPTAVSAQPKAERPHDAWNLLERDGAQLIVVSPPRGMRSETWALLMFTVMWLGFISFWTFGALHPLFHHPRNAPVHWERAIVALFTIPFWMAGLGMLGAVLFSAWGVRHVYFDPSILYCEFRCLTWRRAQTIDRSDVQHAREGVLRVKSGSAVQPNMSVDLVFSKGPFRMPVANEAEQKWLVEAINDYLQEVPYRESPQGDFHVPNWPNAG